MDTELDRIHLQWDTPVCKSAKKTVFGSIERGMDRIRTMLTPRKKGYIADLPRKVKVPSERHLSATGAFGDSSLHL